MSQNIRDAERLVMWHMKSGLTTLMRGAPGMAKTQRVWNSIIPAWANLPRNKGKRLGVSVTFMISQNPTSFSGLPWKGERVWKDPVTEKEYSYTVTDPAIPGWYMCRDLETGEIKPASMFDAVFGILEEWGQGHGDAKRTGLEFLLNMGVAPYYFPTSPGISHVIALSNTDLRDGVTKDFDVTYNRVGVIDVHGDVDVWVDDFADKPYQHRGETWNVSSYTKSFFKQHGGEGKLFSPKPEVQGPWCSPRSATAGDRLIQVAAQESGGKIPVDSSMLVDGLTGIIGDVTTSFMAHLQYAVKLPSVDKVAADPTGTEVPKQADLQMLMAYELAYRANKGNVAPLLTYIDRLNDGMDNIFMTSLMRKNWKEFASEPVIKAWISANVARLSLVSSLAASL